MTLNDAFVVKKWKFFVALFVVGIINNNGYVMVAAGADLLSKDFGKEKLMPLFQLSLILFSSATRLVNSTLLIRI